jgi:hypothetical protein
MATSVTSAVPMRATVPAQDPEPSLRGEADVILAVAQALLAACTVATVVAMALPALFGRLGSTRRSGAGRWRL